jgi:hypothetical protein
MPTAFALGADSLVPRETHVYGSSGADPYRARSLARIRAPACGAGGREFKSCRARSLFCMN